MDGVSYRRLRRSVTIVACLVALAALLTGSHPAGGQAAQLVRVLQLNLCNSGESGCYTGRSVTQAAAVIRAHVPDLVTLNEVCQDDVDLLGQALADVHRGETVVRAFRAARNGNTGGPYRCVRNGQPYGVGLLARLPAPDRAHTTYSGIYPTQDPDDPEQRAWLCLSASAAFYACTTHLAYTSPTVALAQCDHLLRRVIPTLRARGGYEPTVLGGDLNLSYGGSPDLRSCLPPGYLRVDDGSVQQIVATTDFAVRFHRLIDMAGTTDHPSLLVALGRR